MSESTFEIITEYGTFIIDEITYNGSNVYCVESFTLNDPIANFCLPKGISFFKSQAFKDLYNQREMDPREITLPTGLKFGFIEPMGTYHGIASRDSGRTLVGYEPVKSDGLVEVPKMFTNIHPDAFKNYFEEEKFNGIFDSHNNQDFSE